MMTAIAPRSLYRVTGQDRIKFLQGLISNDLTPLEKGKGIIWAALLTPQGKYLADFFLVRPEPDADYLILDIATILATDTIKRLSLYRLRADVQIEASHLQVSCGVSAPPATALPDPRHPAMGWRSYGETALAQEEVDWDAIRVEHCIPASGIELIPNETYLLEAGFERLHGVDFRKGCYVGQEVTARMKHKTELRKGLLTLAIDGAAPVGTTIMSGEKEAGTLFTQSNGKAIAYLRFDRGQNLTAGDATLALLPA